MPRAERLSNLGLLIAMAVSAVVLFVLSRDLTFWSDELDWLTSGDDFAPKTLLTPHNSHLIGLIRIVYELFPRVFDADYLPFRLLSIAAVLACAALFFVLARRRIGGPFALAATLVLLFFGSSSEVVLSPLGLPISLSIAFGLATFVALERGSRGWDVAATCFLVLSILADTFGAIIGGGVLLYLVLDRERRSRAWVAVIPLLLYVAWWIWARQFDQDIAAASNLGSVPSFVIESAAATLGGITGIGKSFGSGSDALQTATKAIFIAIALAGTVLLVVRARRVGGTAALWAFGLTLLAFWTAVGLSESDVRTPYTPRYLLFAAILVFLVLAESFRGERLGRGVRIGVLVVLAGCTVGNLARLTYNSDGLADHASVVRTQIAMVELAGANANPGFRPALAGPPGSRDIVAPAAALNGFADEYGSLGSSLDEVRERPPGERAGGDFVLVRALAAAAVPVDDSVLEATTDCEHVQGGFDLPAGPSVLRPRGDAEAAPLLLGRFGDEPTVDVGTPPPGGLALINLPGDDAGESWAAESAAELDVCSLKLSAG